MAKMSFEEFQATRTHGNLCELAGIDHEEIAKPTHPGEATGHVYVERLWIEDVADDWPAAARAEGRYYLMLGNREYLSNNLEQLERLLYEYASEEGFCDESHPFEVEITRTIVTTHTAWIMVTARDSEEAIATARAREPYIAEGDWTEDESSPAPTLTYRVHDETGEEVDEEEDDFRR